MSCLLTSDTTKTGSMPRSAPPYSGSGSDLLRGRYGSWSADGPTSTSSSSVSHPPASKVSTSCMPSYSSYAYLMLRVKNNCCCFLKAKFHYASELDNA